MSVFVPDLILKGFQEGKTKGFIKGAVMSVDIIGFTEMTSRLIDLGKEGTEMISDMTTQLFDRALDFIYPRRGFVSYFAGDSLTAVFSSEKSETVNSLNCLEAAFEIQKIFKSDNCFMTRVGDFTFTSRIGLSYGDVFWSIAEHGGERVYIFRGKVLKDCIKAQKASFPGVISAEKEFFSISGTRDKAYWSGAGEYYFIDGTSEKLSVKTESSEISLFSEKLTESFIGKAEYNFQKPEFREVIPLFVSCENEEKIEEVVETILSLKNEYGFSHPHVDYGPKGPVILVFFGAPMTYEHMESRALKFLLALKEKHFSIKCGATKGICYCGFNGGSRRREFTCLGDATNIASRLMNAAPWGKIYVDDKIARSENFRFEWVGEHSFKGKKFKTSTYTLIGAVNVAREPFSGEMIGREEEKSQLMDIIKRIGTEESAGAVLIEGEPGVGKTRLVSEVKKELLSDHEVKDNLTWIYVQCDELFRKSFGPAGNIIRRALDQDENQAIDSKRTDFDKKFTEFLENVKNPGLKEELRKQKPIIAEFCGINIKMKYFDLLPDNEKLETVVSSLENFIKGLSRVKPLVVEIDNIQWIDGDTIMLLRKLFKDSRGYPFIVIAEKRLPERYQKKVLFDQKYVKKRIVLRNFCLTDSALLMRTVKPEMRIGSAFLDFVEKLSGGNPFFIEQIVAYASERGIDTENFNEKKPDFEIPPDVNNLIISRIDKMPSGLKTAVKTASVLGAEFSPEILGEMMKNTEIKGYLSEGERQYIWVKNSDTGYLFRHAMIREALYGMQMKKELKILHYLAAKAIKKIHGLRQKNYLVEIAYHFGKAEDEENSYKFYKLAAKSSLRNFRNTEAVRCFENLLDLLDKRISLASDKTELKKEKITFMLKKAQIQYSSGNWRESVATRQEALKLSGAIRDLELKIGILLKLSDSFLKAGDLVKAYDYLKKAKRLWKKSESAEMSAKIENHLGAYLCERGKYDESLEHYRISLKIYSRLKKAKEATKVSGNMGLVYYYQGRYDRAEKFIKKHIKEAEKNNDIYQQLRGMGNLGLVYDDTGDYRRAASIYSQVIKISKKTGFKHTEANTYGNLAGVYFALGKFEKALEYYSKQIYISREISDDTGIYFPLINIASIYITKGKFEEAEKNLDEFREYSLRSRDKRSYAVCIGVRAKMEWRLGNTGQALRLYTQSVAKLEKMKVRYYSCYFRAEKAFLLAELNKFKSALNTLGKTSEEAEALKIQGIASLAKMTEYACGLALAGNRKRKDLFLKKLVKLAEKEKDKTARSKLFFLIWSALNVSRVKNSGIEEEFFRKKAFNSFKSEYKKGGNEECAYYMRKILMV
ncbi:tetratricopeptide repeat protein [candidate division WOR-3 bacterium]|nr:tetratricopeptide repeat protein [candidate division WOR-3 bacterium]